MYKVLCVRSCVRTLPDFTVSTSAENGTAMAGPAGPVSEDSVTSPDTGVTGVNQS